MTPNSGYSLIKVVAGNDYSTIDTTLFALHCVKTNTMTVSLMLQGDKTYTDFPPESFICGAVYSMYLKELKPGSDVEFIGYLYNQKPFSL